MEFLKGRASHEILRRKSSCEKACTFMKIDDVVRHNFDDNALDGYRNLEITKVIEQSFENFGQIVFLPIVSLI